MISGSDFLVSLDLLGTLVFAITGAFRAVKHELDILGVLVLSVFTGVGGGILRDVCLGITPPFVFTHEIYLGICLAGGLLVFFIAPHIARWWQLVKLFDAIGLGVFAAIGAMKGHQHHLGLIGVVMIGTVTAVGGGVVRDILVTEVPAVLTSDFYATAAALGALVLYLGKVLGMDDAMAMLVAAIATILMRLLAMHFRLRLPRVPKLPKEPGRMARRISLPRLFRSISRKG
ncbi:MAG: putative rane protein [Holophagaceae bacterium]|nr:putative rane protein [Holophagaceae bacterium]